MSTNSKKNALLRRGSVPAKLPPHDEDIKLESPQGGVKGSDNLRSLEPSRPTTTSSSEGDEANLSDAVSEVGREEPRAVPDCLPAAEASGSQESADSAVGCNFSAPLSAVNSNEQYAEEKEATTSPSAALDDDDQATAEFVVPPSKTTDIDALIMSLEAIVSPITDRVEFLAATVTERFTAIEGQLSKLTKQSNSQSDSIHSFQESLAAAFASENDANKSFLSRAIDSISGQGSQLRLLKQELTQELHSIAATRDKLVQLGDSQDERFSSLLDRVESDRNLLQQQKAEYEAARLELDQETARLCQLRREVADSQSEAKNALDKARALSQLAEASRVESEQRLTEAKEAESESVRLSNCAKNLRGSIIPSSDSGGEWVPMYGDLEIDVESDRSVYGRHLFAAVIRSNVLLSSSNQVASKDESSRIVDALSDVGVCLYRWLAEKGLDLAEVLEIVIGWRDKLVSISDRKFEIEIIRVDEPFDRNRMNFTPQPDGNGRVSVVRSWCVRSLQHRFKRVADVD